MHYENQILIIEGMTCLSCANRVEKTVTSLTGINKASVDFLKKKLRFEFNPSELTLQRIISAINKSGYQATEQIDFEHKTNLVETASPAELKRHLLTLPILFGITGTLSITSIYIVFLSILNSPEYAWFQFLFMGRWMIPLVIGFGVQVGVFSYMRRFAKLAKSGQLTGVPIAASAGISTGSMIACCLHHVVDVLPLLGLSAAAIFISQFQPFLLAIGIVSNLIGISFMLYTIQKHHLYLIEGNLSTILKWNMKPILFSVTGLGIVSLAYLFYTLL